jgi:hypothetical protein
MASASETRDASALKDVFSVRSHSLTWTVPCDASLPISFVPHMEISVDRIRKILVATDHSNAARRAETRAAMLSVELSAAQLGKQ